MRIVTQRSVNVRRVESIHLTNLPVYGLYT